MRESFRWTKRNLEWCRTKAARLPLVYYEKGYDFRKVRLSSRPVPIPGDTTSWTVLDVI